MTDRNNSETDPVTSLPLDPSQAADLLGKIAAAGRGGLEISADISSENLHGGLLGFWGLVESTEGDGRITYRLPPDAIVDINEVLKNGELGSVKDQIENRGFAYTSFEALGLSGTHFDFAEHLLHTYFEAGLLKQCEGDVPPDRKRARGVAYFGQVQPDAAFFGADGIVRRGGGTVVGEYPERSVAPRKDDNITKRVEYPRIRIADDDSLLIYSTFLAQLSEEMFSTVGLNMFEVKTNVVEQLHQDGTEIGSVAVLEVDGGGAESLLYENKDGNAGKLVFRQRLEPGQIFLFKDGAFFHGATPLIPRCQGHVPKRRALITTTEPGIKNDWTRKLPMLLGTA